MNENEQEQSGIGMDEERERRVLHADNLEQLALLFGSLDENIETVAQRTGARIGSVGTEITVTGTREQADLACTVLEKLIAIVRGVSADQCSKVANALYAGGVRLMEISFSFSILSITCSRIRISPLIFIM